MTDCELVCNFRKCRKKLSSWAWVTSCSHIFCDEDGSREFAKSYSCPTCSTELRPNIDMNRVNLNPSDQYKSIVLSGLKPETIIEIASKAMSFWAYQTQHELVYQEYVATKAKEQKLQLEQYYEQIMLKTQAEFKTMKKKYDVTKQQLEDLKKKYHFVNESLIDTKNQHKKVQTHCEHLKRKLINPNVELMADLNLDTPLCRPPPFRMHIGGEGDHSFKYPLIQGAASGEGSSSNVLNNTMDKDFHFNPTGILAGSGKRSKPVVSLKPSRNLLF